MTDGGRKPLYSYQLISTHVDGLHEGFLAVRELPDGLESPSRYGFRIEVPGKFSSKEDLVTEAKRHFTRFSSGEVGHDAIPVERLKLRGYRLLGTARFQIVDLKWEPVLYLKKIEEPNRGHKQTVMGPDTVFPRNLFRSPDLAARFAVDFGKAMVIGFLNGLEI